MNAILFIPMRFAANNSESFLFTSLIIPVVSEWNEKNRPYRSTYRSMQNISRTDDRHGSAVRIAEKE